MAKDDYDVILCKTLVYYYGVLKRKTVFNKTEFLNTAARHVNEDYLTDILRMASAEGLLTGIVTVKAWGGAHLLASDLSDAEITPDGIRYLRENSTAKRILQALKDRGDVMAALASLLGLFG